MVSLFAATIRLEIPYSEYWLPLLIGAGVGLVAIFAARLAFARRPESVVATAAAKPPQEYDPFVQGSLTEQRKAFRRSGNPTEIRIQFGDRKGPPNRGWVLDRSVGGLCILVEEEYKPGMQLAVLPVNAPEMTPCVEIEVRSARQCPEGYELGCQFIKTPAWSILLMFG